MATLQRGADKVATTIVAGEDESRQSPTRRHAIATPANIVTCMRFALMPVWLVLAEMARGPANEGLHSSSFVAWCACGLYIFISLTDKLDGYLAKSRNEITDFGKVMDPLADKLSVAMGMTWLMEAGLLPSWMLLVVLTREFLVSGLRMLVAKDGTIVAASGLGKAKTACTMTGICFLMAYATLPLAIGEADMISSAPHFLWVQVIGDVLMWVAMLLTVWSGADYAKACWGAVTGTTTDGD